MSDLVEFKSSIDNYGKEESDVKNNILRKMDEDERFTILATWKPGDDLMIKITNSKLERSFTRKVRDVTWWFDLVIITWGEKT